MLLEDLTEIDYQILKFFKANGPSGIEDAKKVLIDIESLEYRIEYLSTPEMYYSGRTKIQMKNSSCLKQAYLQEKDENGITHTTFIDSFSITTFGRKALQDYEVAEKQHRKEIWLVNAKIPIVVSFIAVLLGRLFLLQLKLFPPYICTSISSMIQTSNLIEGI